MPQASEELFTTFSKCFDFFNEKLFDNQIKDCILNFSRRSGRNYGYFASSRWQGIKDDTTKHEISINPENMQNRGDTPEEALKDIMSTLVHEMCHAWQQDYGKPGKGNYHNREWAEKMISVGLIPSKTGAPGGKKTGSPMTHYIEENGLFDNVYKQMPEGLKLPFLGIYSLTKKTSFTSSVAYKCYTCNYSVRGKAGIKLFCGTCANELEGII